MLPGGRKKSNCRCSRHEIACGPEPFARVGSGSQECRLGNDSLVLGRQPPGSRWSLTHCTNPKGIPPQSPGLRAASYPGETVRISVNPNGVAAVDGQRMPQPRWGWGSRRSLPRVARGSQPWAGGHNPFGIGKGPTALRLHADAVEGQGGGRRVGVGEAGRVAVKA